MSLVRNKHHPHYQPMKWRNKVYFSIYAREKGVRKQQCWSNYRAQWEWGNFLTYTIERYHNLRKKMIPYISRFHWTRMIKHGKIG